MKVTRKEKGITLIALIITIVVLLILAAVAIAAIQNDGIIGHAQNATNKYNEAQGNEQTILDGYLGILDSVVNGWKDNGDGSFTKGETTVKIGDYVNYTYDTASAYSLSKAHSGYEEGDQSIAQTTGLKWRVLGINARGELQLISTTPTDVDVYLQGATGYNNGVFLLNDICKAQYSNKELGITGRSLNIEDIERQYNEEGKKARDEDDHNEIKYGETMSYGAGYNFYPTIYAEESGSGINGMIREGGISASDPYYTSASQLSIAYNSEGEEVTTSKATSTGSLVVTNTAYILDDSKGIYFKNKDFHELILGTESYYWLASRSVGCYSDCTHIGLHIAGNCAVDMWDIFYSDAACGYNACLLRPVVSLPSDITVTTNNQANSETNMWSISKAK